MAATLVRMPCRNVVIFGGKGPFLVTPISVDMVDPAFFFCRQGLACYRLMGSPLSGCVPLLLWGFRGPETLADILPPDMTGQVASSSCPPAPLLLPRSPTVTCHMPTQSPDQAVAFFYLKRHVTDVFKMQNG